MITCYDHYTAKIVAASSIDCILVGDSAAMVMHGHQTTVPATADMMAIHVAAVAKGAPQKFLIGDMPFLSVRRDRKYAMKCVEKLMQAGANAVKIEGVAGHERIISHIVGSGVPVMGHLGLTPQSVNQLGGFKVQGVGEKAEKAVIEDAKKLEGLGVFAIVLECVPSALAEKVTKAVAVPTIGIGAGAGTDGQVLVLQDMLGLIEGFRPKFLRTYLDGFAMFRDAVDRYHAEVVEGSFPGEKESY